MNNLTSNTFESRYTFYVKGFNGKVTDYLQFGISVSDYKRICDIQFRLRNLGELDDALTVIKNKTRETINSGELTATLNGLMRKGTMREILGIASDDMLVNTELHKVEDISIAKLTSTINDFRPKLVTEIEEEIRMSIDMLDLIIKALGCQ